MEQETVKVQNRKCPGGVAAPPGADSSNQHLPLSRVNYIKSSWFWQGQIQGGYFYEQI